MTLGIAKSDAEVLIAQVAKSIGLSQNVSVIPCGFSGKAAAWYARDFPGIPNGEYIVYNPDWVREVIGSDRFQAIVLFGHELGHFANRHFESRRELQPIEKETEADHFAGCAVARLGGSFSTLEGLLSRLRKESDSAYPGRLASLEEARRGYENCGGGAPVPVVDSASTLGNALSGSPKLTAERSSFPGFNEAAQSLLSTVINGFAFTVALHQDIGRRISNWKFDSQAQSFMAASEGLSRGRDASVRLFAALANYSASLTAVNRGSGSNREAVDAVAGAVNRLLGEVYKQGGILSAMCTQVVTNEAAGIKAAGDFAEAVERADLIVTCVVDQLTGDLDALAMTVNGTKRNVIRMAYELPESDRLARRRALVARLALLQGELGTTLKPVGSIRAPEATAALSDKGSVEEMLQVERLLQATDAWYVPLEARIEKNVAASADAHAMLVQAGKAVLAWKELHASLPVAVREKRIPDTALLVAEVNRLRELVATLKNER